MKGSLILILFAVVVGGLIFYFRSSFSGLEKEGALGSFGSLSSGDFFEFELRGSAMSPNYTDYSWCRVDKNSYKDRAPQRGEVIFFNGHTSIGQEAQFVKRVIGLPGERIMIAGGLVYLNGSVLPEPYLAADIKTNVLPDGFLKENQEITIAENSYFVLGDNRNYSLDSRESSFGFVKSGDIVGKIISCTPKT